MEIKLENLSKSFYQKVVYASYVINLLKFIIKPFFKFKTKNIS